MACKSQAQTQNERLISHLRRYGSISSYEAFERYGITRLSARIFDVKRMGYNITTKTKTKRNADGNCCTYAVYVLEEVNEIEHQSSYYQRKFDPRPRASSDCWRYARPRLLRGGERSS